jgi:hypothetical protein
MPYLSGRRSGRPTAGIVIVLTGELREVGQEAHCPS